MDYLTIIYYAVFATIFCFLFLQNIHYSSRIKQLKILNIDKNQTNTDLNFRINALNLKIYELESSLKKQSEHPDILGIMADLNKGATILRVERIDPDFLFTWSPRERGN
jgi:hypothetical protein